MHLASDYTLPYKDAGGRPALPRADLPPRRRARRSSGDLLETLQQPRWVCHQLRGGDSRGSDPEQQTAPWIGDATWKTLDRASLAILVGGEV